MALTDKQALFVEEYLVDLNATQAAIRAGYSSDTAGAIGHENLNKPEIAGAISEAFARRMKRTEIDQDRVLKELAAVAFGDIREMFTPGGHLLSPVDLSDEAAALLAGFDVVTVKRGEGEVDHIAKIKRNDKMKALEMLGRHLGMFNDKLILKDDTKDLSDEELDAELAEAERAEAEAAEGKATSATSS